jgi:7-carboxy-7-deazaguanine synthase
MSKIKVAELFYSIQGEGRYMGVPSVFLRTFGCNFTCGGFGLPKGVVSNERVEVANDGRVYTEYNQLPLVSTGCDSYASWDIAFKHLSPVVETSAIVDRIMEILPFNQWREEHLVITGGEPLLGWQRAYPELLSDTRMHNLKEITFETNGTQEISEQFEKYLRNWTLYRGKDRLTFSVSAKLSASGEKWEDAVKPEIVRQYETIGYTYLKFVVADELDVAEALHATNVYRQAGFVGPVYLMGVGGVEDVFYKTNKQVAELAMKHGLRYSDRMQVGLFRNAWGT